MAEVDVAKLKRLRAAAASALDNVPEKSAHGLPPTYNALRKQVAEAVPEGLRDELASIAPEVQVAAGGYQPDVIASQLAGAKSYAHLAALEGWLGAVIGNG